MSPFAIVIRFYVFKDFYFRFFPGFEFHPVNQFHFKRVNETLGDRIVLAIALFAHAAHKLVLSE